MIRLLSGDSAGEALVKRWIRQSLAENPLLATLYPVAKHSLIYLAGAVLVGLGNFVLVPLYTRYLSSSDFGVYALVEISVLLAVTVTQMGLSTTYLRWYAETEPARHGAILGASLAGGVTASLLGGAALAFGVVLTEGPQWFAGHRYTAWMLLPLVVLRNVEGILFSSLQAAQRSVVYGACAVVRLLGLVGAGYWFVARHSQGVRGVLNGWMVGDGLCVAVLLACCLPGMNLRIQRNVLGPMLRYGYPLVWSALMALLLDAAGRYFLARFDNLAEVARYTVAIKITNILSMGFLQPFGSALAGAAFPIAHRPNAPLIYTKLMGYALVIAALLAGITILFGPLLIRIFAGPGYSGVQQLLPFLLLPVMFRLLEYWSSLPIYLTYRTQWLGPLATLSAAVCLVLNYALVPHIGALGAAIAWAAALGSSISAMTWVGRRFYPLPLDLRTCAFAASLWLAPVIAVRLNSFGGMTGMLRLSCTASALLVLACLLYFHWDVRASRPLFRGATYATD